MSTAPTVIVDLLRPTLGWGVTLIGIFALLLAAASVIPTSKAFGLFDTGHVIAVADCWSSGDGGSGSHVEAQNCSLHSGCVSIGVLPAAPAVAAVHGQGWKVASYPVAADWADFPTKPPPIVSL